MEYQNHSCEHADHEYVGSIKYFIVFGGERERPVDIFFLDETGGHEPHYHGCCIRYSNEPDEYASYAEMHHIENKPIIWELYLQWCKVKGYQPQTYEWLTENKHYPLTKRNCYVEDNKPHEYVF